MALAVLPRNETPAASAWREGLAPPEGAVPTSQQSELGYNLLRSSSSACVILVLKDPPTLGDSLSECRRKLGFHEGSSIEVLKTSPLNSSLSFLRPESTAVWVFNSEAVASRIYLFASFQDSKKTKLTDLIEFKGGHKYPRVRGIYHEALANVQPGMNLDQVFARCGPVMCEYFRDVDHGWRVRFTYTGHGSSQFVFEAEARSGKICKVFESRI